jgi:ABC-type glycerol-3-phosphate transport system permease component
VTSIQGPDGSAPAQFGEIGSWAITKTASASASEKFVEYMLGKGYQAWMGLSPRGVHFLFLAVYLFPSIVLAIPLFVLFTRLGLRGNLVGLVLIYISQTVPVAVYMLRNYFQTVPRSLEEAAAADGCSRLGILWHVTLPLARPAIISTALYVFMIAWNEYFVRLAVPYREP